MSCPRQERRARARQRTYTIDAEGGEGAAEWLATLPSADLRAVAERADAPVLARAAREILAKR